MDKILIPDKEGALRGGTSIVLKPWFKGEVSRQGDSRTLEEQGDVVWEQLRCLRGEGDGERLAIAVDLVTQEFL